MALAAGDTFFAPWPEKDAVEHLYFVISDPALDSHRVVVVPLMTWDKYKEQTCIIGKGEHPFVRHNSYIDYGSGCAREIDAATIERNLQSKVWPSHAAASPDLLKKIRDGAGKSDFLPLDLRDILEDQELVDPL
ncbi:MAG: hypothetical protein AMXMBFR7_50570 [Planctomycetota bacterium]